MDFVEVLRKVSVYMPQFLATHLRPELTFHNVRHTIEVVEAAKEIGIEEELTDYELLVVQLAAWFHDCGYAMVYTGHEESSAVFARDFLEGLNCPESLILNIVTDIENTKYPATPVTLTGKVLCDADLYHLTRPNYHRYEEALRAEMKHFLGKTQSGNQWWEVNCAMMAEHVYHTEYGKEVLAQFKAINFESMQCGKFKKSSSSDQ